MKAIFALRGEKMVSSTKMLSFSAFTFVRTKIFGLLRKSSYSLLATVRLFFYQASDENIRLTYEIKRNNQIFAAVMKHYNSSIFLLHFFI